MIDEKKQIEINKLRQQLREQILRDNDFLFGVGVQLKGRLYPQVSTKTAAYEDLDTTIFNIEFNYDDVTLNNNDYSKVNNDE